MLYYKNASQQRLPFTLNPRALYRGYVANLANLCTKRALAIPSAAAITTVLTGGTPRRLTGMEQFAAALGAGFLSSFIVSPIELVMIQQQRFGTSLFGTPIALVKSYGPAALGRGFTLTCGRESVYTAGLLGLGPSIKRKAKEDFGFSNNVAGVVGAVVAGVLCATLSHPLDTIKTCMQGDVQRLKYNGATHTATELYTQGGLKRMFSGWGWRTGRTVLQVFFMDKCRESLCPLMFPHHYD